MKHRHSEEVVYQAVKSGELEIDGEGRVWRLQVRHGDRWTGGTKLTARQRARAENPTSGGYLQVRAMHNGKRSCASAARLVWLHFRGPIPDGLTINHLNGDKTDNRPGNLELAIYSRQRTHAVRELGARHHDVKGESNPKAQATTEQVIEMRKRRAAGERVKDIAHAFGMTPKAVSHICQRRTWAHLS